MEKKGVIQRSNDPKTACIVKKVSEITGVTPQYVRMVRNGERKNETVFCTYMDLLEGFDSLVDAVKETVRFESSTKNSQKSK